MRFLLNSPARTNGLRFALGTTAFGAILCLGVGPARADIIPGLFNTGGNNMGIGNTAGGLFAEGAVDPHYRLTVSADATAPGPSTFVVQSNGYPIGPFWMPNGPSSQWLAPMANQNAPTFGNSPGNYTYQTTFNLAGLNPATATLAGAWAVDNIGRIMLNGTQISQINAEPTFGIFHNFSVAAGSNLFNPGINTLDILVTNLLQPPPFRAINPTGVRLEISGTASRGVSPVPEPGTLALAGMGVVGLLGYGWRRRSALAV
jgi:hypothetical protein